MRHYRLVCANGVIVRVNTKVNIHTLKMACIFAGRDDIVKILE